MNEPAVSFKTARKLKEVGFPHPQLAAGQVWYTSEGLAVKYLSIPGSNIRTSWLWEDRYESWINVPPNEPPEFFAPRIEDIVNNMPSLVGSDLDDQPKPIPGQSSMQEMKNFVEKYAYMWIERTEQSE